MNKIARNNIKIPKNEYNQCIINWRSNCVQSSGKCWLTTVF